MRPALVLCFLCIPGPALAEEIVGSFNVQSINGVRVWRSKPATVSAVPSAAPQPPGPPPITIVINPAPIVTADDGLIAGSIGGPFFYSSPFFRGRPFVHSRPSFHSGPFFAGDRAGSHGRPVSIQPVRGRF